MLVDKNVKRGRGLSAWKGHQNDDKQEAMKELRTAELIEEISARLDLQPRTGRHVWNLYLIAQQKNEQYCGL